MKTPRFIRTSLLVALAVTALAAQAKNVADNRSKQAMPTTVEATWHTECSGCHDAYAPGLLPAASWQKIMSGLDKHFGADASLPPQETEKIAAFLEKNASNRWSSRSMSTVFKTPIDTKPPVGGLIRTGGGVLTVQQQSATRVPTRVTLTKTAFAFPNKPH